jgi:DNA-binding NarL/FixJ family response regulator
MGGHDVTVLVVTQDYCHARLLASHLSRCLGWDATARRQLPEALSRRGSDTGVLIVEYAVLDRAQLALPRMRHLLSALPTLIIGVHGRDDILPLICAGLRGCVGAQADEGTIAQAARTIAAGGRWFDSRAVAPRLAELATILGPRSLDLVIRSHLTVREGCVLALLAQGATCEEMANVLSVSSGTARNILSTLYRKLGVRRRHAAVAEAEKGVCFPLPGDVTIRQML